MYAKDASVSYFANTLAAAPPPQFAYAALGAYDDQFEPITVTSETLHAPFDYYKGKEKDVEEVCVMASVFPR